METNKQMFSYALVLSKPEPDHLEQRLCVGHIEAGSVPEAIGLAVRFMERPEFKCFTLAKIHAWPPPVAEKPAKQPAEPAIKPGMILIPKNPATNDTVYRIVAVREENAVEYLGVGGWKPLKEDTQKYIFNHLQQFDRYEKIEERIVE